MVTDDARLLGAKLQRAANDGQDVCRLLQLGADPNMADVDGRTALHYAAMNGHALNVIALAAYGCDLHARTNNGRTALHGACWNGHMQVALQLIDMGADPHVKSLDGSTPLMDAARNNHSETVMALVTIAGCDIHAWEAGGRTALHFAALNGHTETVKVLVDLGADVNSSDADGSRPLHFASWNGHTDTVHILLLHGANQEHRDIYASTALHDAALSGRTATAALLLDFRADVDARNNRGITPLQSAASSGHRETTELLLRRTADVSVLNDDGRTALHFATWNCHPRIAFLLLQYGADMFTCSDDGLMAADILCHPDFDWPDDILPHLHKLRLPNTPLHTAADKGDAQRVTKLAGCGVDVNCQNKFGDTPLHWAVRARRLNTSTKLIELGADVLRSNDNGVTVYEEIAAYLDRIQQECIRRKVVQMQEKSMSASASLALSQCLSSRLTSVSSMEGSDASSAHAPQARASKRKERPSNRDTPPMGAMRSPSPIEKMIKKPMRGGIAGSISSLEAEAGLLVVAHSTESVCVRASTPVGSSGSSSTTPKLHPHECGKNPDFLSDCNPDDMHNVCMQTAAWSVHPVRNACMQVEAWMSNLPGVRMWHNARTQLGLQTALVVVSDIVRKPAITAAEATDRWVRRISWARSLVKDVTGAALQGDAKAVIKAVRQVSLVDNVVLSVCSKAGEWSKRWHHMFGTSDDVMGPGWHKPREGDQSSRSMADIYSRA